MSKVEEVDNQNENELINYEENIPDLPDDEIEPMMDFLEEFEKLADNMSLTPVQAFVMYGAEYPELTNLVEKLMTLMSQKDMDEILDKMRKANNKKEEIVENKKVVIKIKKGLQLYEIKEYIKEIDSVLKKDKNLDLSIYCSDWENGPMHPALVPACKKLLAKYSEAGLLGCIAQNGYIKMSQELYCYAYVKGVLHEDKIKFQNIDVQDYKNKLMKSLINYSDLINNK